jgi:hypothetical protein
MAGSVHLDHIYGAAIRNRAAHVALIAWPLFRRRFAVNCFRQQTRHGRFTHATRTGEQIGMPYSPGLNRILQRLDDVLLPD